LQDLAVRAELDRGQLEALAAAGACAPDDGQRRRMGRGTCCDGKRTHGWG
jgi:hypothetical protein